MGNVQCDHMAKFMPDYRFPIGIVTDGRGRAVGGDHIPKANAKKTWVVWHAKSADPKITLIGKHFDDNGVIQFKVVFIAEGCLVLSEQ